RRGATPYFGDPGVLLTQVDVSARDAATNVAPVSVRLIPVISELALDARDGTQLRRSQAALFAGLARRARSGPLLSGSGSFDGPAPYVDIPALPCRLACPGRIDPEYTFSSSRPDIGDFVKLNVDANDAHAVLLDQDGKAISDPSSGLFCAFNA